MSEDEKSNADVTVSLSRRKTKHASEEDKMAKMQDEKTPPASSKLAKRKSMLKLKVKFSEENWDDDQKLIDQEIDKLLQGDELDVNELFGIQDEDKEGESSPNPRLRDLENEQPSLASLAGINITEVSEDSRTSQEECLQSWMERRLNDENGK